MKEEITCKSWKHNMIKKKQREGKDKKDKDDEREKEIIMCR